MARRQITDESDDLDREMTADFDDVSERVKDEEASIDEMLAEFGNTPDDVVLSFKIFKVRPNSKLTDFCFAGTKEDFPIVPRVQRECGGGTYTAFIYKTVNGKTTLWKKPSFGVLELRQPPQPLQLAAPSADPNFSKLLELLERQTEQRAQNQPMSITQIATATAAIISAAAPLIQMLRGPSQSNSLADQLDTLAKLKDLTEAPEPQDDSWAGMFKAVVPALIDATGKTQTPQRPQLAAPQPTTAPTPEQIRAAQMAQLKQNLGYMITRAQKNSPPDLYADFLEDNLPPEFMQMLKQPGAYEFLATIEPAIQTFKPWFDALLQSLRTGPMEDEGDANGEDLPLVSERSASVLSAGHDPQWSARGSEYIEGDGDESEGG